MLHVQMADSDQELALKTVTKLLLSAEHYASVSPALARFHMLEAERVKKKLRLPASTASQICRKCFLIRRPDNCTQRLLPRMKTKRQARKLDRKIAAGGAVGKLGKSLLDLHSEGANRLAFHCQSCGWRASVRGAGRPAKVSQASNLSASTKKQEQVANKKKKKKKKNRTADSSTEAGEILFVGKETKGGKLEKYPKNQTSPLVLDSDEKQRVRNKKGTQKQKHNMLQNILKRNTNAASPDASAVLRSFLMSL